MIRKADPYRDTDVIDARAPRTNQAIVGTLSLLALITGWWPILGVLAGQLAIGLVFGRRYCLPCLLYFEVIQPRVGEGRIEDSRPPRFANIVGAVFLGAATIAYLVGLNAIGLVLGLLVAGLALLAAITGLCVGCEIYRFAARLRGVRARRIDSVDLIELGASTGSMPYGGEAFEIDFDFVVHELNIRTSRGDRGAIQLVPMAVAVTSSGAVVERLA